VNTPGAALLSGIQQLEDWGSWEGGDTDRGYIYAALV
jgi:hypothetical protein